MSKIRVALLLSLVVALAVAVGCGSDDDSSDDSTSASSVSLDDCQADQLQTKADGTLTVATDKPAFPPYVIDDDPTNGKGFESAVAYAIADQLGFADDDVTWTRVPFNSSYAPGPKDFDFDVNQISITPKREQQVDFSSPYYEADQSIVVQKGSELDGVTSLADLQDATIGVQIGTTSLDAVNEAIQPSSDPQVFDTSNDVVAALKNDQVDAIVVDTPTAIYLTAVQVPTGTVAGTFPAPGGDAWGALLEKDSPITDCVSAAVDELKSSGELAAIQKQWIDKAVDAPALQ